MPDPDLVLLHAELTQFTHLGRSGLLPALQAAQRLYGWISETTAAEVARSMQVPLADVHGVIEFYAMLYNQPVGSKIVRICTDQACVLQGGAELLHQFCAHHQLQPNQTSPDGSLTIEAAPCLGLCELAPAALAGDEPLAPTTLNGLSELQSTHDPLPASRVYGSPRVLTANCGHGTTALALYGDYTALRRGLELSPDTVITEIKASGLVGRGGAAFPTAVKWEGARRAPGTQKYVVCNADESEPGTFKDRILLHDDPHRVLEGMLLAGYAIGSSKGYIYLRGEYPYLLPVIETAITEARQAGLLGSKIMGSDFSFDIEIRLGAGAYICGEETALFESIEGKRGFPRVKPPFPTTQGLFNQPTVINNVETLCNVPIIISQGAQAYRQYGTEKSTGTKLFCLSGDVHRGGLYEVPFGVTLRHLIEDLAGGVRHGREMKALLVGGAAGAFATPEQLDARLTFEDLRSAGLPLGSGVVLVFDESRDLRQALALLGHFFAHESCGKCYPCQLGTQRQKEILDRLSGSGLLPGDFDRLQDIGWTMADASLCGLGQTAASAVLSAMRHWPELFTS